MPFMQQGKKKTHLRRVDLDVAYFIDEKTIIRGKLLYNLMLQPGPFWLMKQTDKIWELNESSTTSLVDGLAQIGRGQACFPSAGGANPDNILHFAHIVKGVV